MLAESQRIFFPFLFQGEPGQEDFLACYAQLEGLCQAMMSELASDRRLHDSGILPGDVCLPQVTAAQYCKVTHLLLPCSYLCRQHPC